MAGYLASFLQSTPFLLGLRVLIVFFIVSAVETIFCIARAMCFRVEELSGYWAWFFGFYKVSVDRGDVSWDDCKSNWFLWLSVLVNNICVDYSSFVPFQNSSLTDDMGSFIKTKAVFLFRNIVILVFNALFFAFNAIKYLSLVVLVPFYLVFSFISFFERVFRLVLGPVAFSVFWVSARIKIRLLSEGR